MSNPVEGNARDKDKTKNPNRQAIQRIFMDLIILGNYVSIVQALCTTSTKALYYQYIGFVLSIQMMCTTFALQECDFVLFFSHRLTKHH